MNGHPSEGLSNELLEKAEEMVRVNNLDPGRHLAFRGFDLWKVVVTDTLYDYLVQNLHWAAAKELIWLVEMTRAEVSEDTTLPRRTVRRLNGRGPISRTSRSF